MPRSSSSSQHQPIINSTPEFATKYEVAELRGELSTLASTVKNLADTVRESHEQSKEATNDVRDDIKALRADLGKTGKIDWHLIVGMVSIFWVVVIGVFSWGYGIQNDVAKLGERVVTLKEQAIRSENKYNYHDSRIMQVERTLAAEIAKHEKETDITLENEEHPTP